MYRRILTIVLLAVTGYVSRAGIEERSVRIEGGDMGPGVMATVSDPRMGEMMAGSSSTWAFNNVNVDGFVEVGVDYHLFKQSNTATTYNIQLLITYMDWGGSSFVTHNITKNISVRYNGATGTGAYTDKATVKVPGAHYMQVRIGTVTDGVSPVLSVSAFPDMFYMDARIRAERQHKMKLDTYPSFSSVEGINLDAGTAPEELELRWDYFAGAEEYQLEYTWVSDYTGEVSGSGSSAVYGQLAKEEIPFSLSDFELNCTRVVTSNQHYRIPLTFERGYLLYRLRGVSHGTSTAGHYTKTVYSRWSTDALTTAGAVETVDDYVGHRFQVERGHERDKNWQVKASFAEEGKRKDVIGYYDGTLRNRQNVTKINSDQNAIAGETVYDYLGRPSANFLPVPTGDDALKFYADFNVTAVNTPYNMFDLDFGMTDCTAEQQAADDVSGAEQYYSVANSVNQSHKDYIPKSNGFAYTQVQYTPDNTGRVREQTGVGDKFNLASGHSTKYMYGQPTQEQLDRIFGSDAGNALHYKKNAVVDANGQVSVSYLDMQGRTIATALAGNNATNLAFLKDTIANDELKDVYASDMVVDLLNKNNEGDVDDVFDNNHLNPDGTALSYSSNHIVGTEGTHNFTYTLTNDKYTDDCLGDVCYPFVYDVELSVKNACGEEVTDGGFDPVFSINDDYMEMDSLCSGVDGVDITRDYTSHNFFASLPVGEYTISKTLKINQAALDHFAALYANNIRWNGGDCYVEHEDLVNYEINGELAATDCEVTCEECVEALIAEKGTKAEYVDAGEEEEEEARAIEWQALYDDCVEPCSYTSLCEVRFYQMLADVSPGGQYGQTNASMGDYVVSVYNPNNALPKNRVTPATTPGNLEHWREPAEPYKTATGALDYVSVTGHTGAYTPAITNPALLTIQPDGSFITPPENLANLSDFVSRFQESWARSLVLYHPEYAYYEWCDAADKTTMGAGGEAYTSQEYDSLLNNTDTYAAADAMLVPHGTDPVDLTSTGLTYGLLDSDPFFNDNTKCSLYIQLPGSINMELDGYAMMLDKLQNYLGTGIGMAEVAKMNARCPAYYGTSASPCTTTALFANAGTEDAEWIQLKSMYISLKQEIMQVLSDYKMIGYYYGDNISVADVTTPNGYCGCIGEDDFWMKTITDRSIPVGFDEHSIIDDYKYFPDFGVSTPATVALPYYDNPYQRTSMIQPCSRFIASSYANKTRRFGIPVQESDINDGGYSLYEATGLCPVAYDLRYFLEYMGTSGHIDDATYNLEGTAQFSLNLYEAMGATTVSYDGYDWEATVNGGNNNILDIDFTNTGTSCTGMTLTSTSSPDLEWDDYGTGPGEWHITGTQTMTVTDADDFVITFLVDHDNNAGTAALALAFNGHTPACLVLDGCTFPVVCKANDVAKNAVELMNALMLNDNDGDTNEDFYDDEDLSNSTPGDVDYTGIFERNLSWFLPAAGGGVDHYWKAMGSGVYHIYDNPATSGNPYLQLSFGVNPTAQLSFGLPVATTTPGQFTVDAWDISTGAFVSNYAVTMTLHDGLGGSTTVDVGGCATPQPMTCNTPEVNNAQSLLKLLNNFVGTGSSQVGVNNGSSASNVLTGSPDWSSSLQNQVAPSAGAVLVADGTLSSSVFNIPITTQDQEDEEEPTYYCNIGLEAGGTGIDFTDITGFTNLVADYTGPITGGYPTQFKVTAILPGPVEVVLTGNACFALDNCVSSDCPEDDSDLGSQQYGTMVSNITNGTQGLYQTYTPVTGAYMIVIPGYSTTAYPCSDEWYDVQQAAITNVGYYFVDLDLPTFCNNGYAGCADAYISYLTDVYSSPADFISIADFCNQGISATCVEAYDQYLAGEPEEPLTMIEFAQNCAPVVPCVQNPLSDLVSMPVTPLSEMPDPCEEYNGNVAEANASLMQNSYLNSLVNNFIANYKKQALKDAVETFTMEYSENEFHYTLYYYDQAGNLVRTVPPQGVVVLTPASDLDADMQDDMDEIKTDRANNTHNYNIPHRYLTTYTYNSLNQLVKQNTPDAGTSLFWYDRLGRLVVSQNAKQLPLDLYSYTRYDELGRIMEVGQIEKDTLMTESLARNDQDLKDWIKYADKTEVTHTLYDEEPALAVNPLVAENLRNRVAAVFYQDEYTDRDALDNTTPGTTNYEHATHYSYDIHGNVKELVQEFPGMGAHVAGQEFKQMQYDYDLISGKVNRFDYQPGGLDAMSHEYVYDADNRLTNVYTSVDDVHWDHDAKYFYYAHGPLARTEYGHWKNQGTDYAYTVQGWIKGVNSDMLNVEKDMGFDGRDTTTNVNRYTGADAYGYSLGYFTDDYESINTTDFLADRSSATYLGTYGKNLYNGNIGHMITTLPDGIDVDMPDRQLGAYMYDQLNRIKQAKYWQENSFTGDDLNSGTASQKYLEQYKYDGNGNILNLRRWDGAGTAMDNMTYNYYEKSTSTQRNGFGSGYYSNDMSNRLGYVDDGVSSGVSGVDIDDQSSGNYTYDEIGQLTGDAAEEIEEIQWTVKNKVHKVIRTSSSGKADLEFVYDAMGNRVCKIVKPDGTSVENGGTDQPTNWNYTYYNLDASGNTLTVYEVDATNDDLMLTEQYIYGSDRAGVLNRNVDMSGSLATDDIYNHTLGKKTFELKNHLGNVLVTVSDMPFAMDDSGSDNITDAFEPQVMTVQDYSPFGTLMDGRQTSATDSKYGFNGMRKDDELKGSGNSYDFGARLYDSRLGRFLTPDPQEKKYAYMSAYAFCENSPIRYVDPDGRTGVSYIEVVDSKTGKSSLLVVTNYDIESGSRFYKITGSMDENYNFTVTQFERVEGEGSKLMMQFELWPNTTHINVGKGQSGWGGLVIWGSGGETGGRKASVIWGTFDYGEMEDFFEYMGGGKNAREKEYNPYNKGDYKHDSEEANKKSGERLDKRIKQDDEGEGNDTEGETGNGKMPGNSGGSSDSVDVFKPDKNGKMRHYKVDKDSSDAKGGWVTPNSKNSREVK